MAELLTASLVSPRYEADDHTASHRETFKEVMDIMDWIQRFGMYRFPQEPPRNSWLDWLPESHPLIPMRCVGLSTIGISASRLPQLPFQNGLLLTSLCGEWHSPNAHLCQHQSQLHCNKFSLQGNLIGHQPSFSVVSHITPVLICVLNLCVALV